jgi:hypothetical protein
VWTVDHWAEENVAPAGRGEDPRLVVYFTQSEQGWPMNYANTVVMVNLYGEHPDSWVGRDIELYVDPDVEYDRQKVGGIRLRAPSGAAVKVDAAPKSTAPQKKIGDLSSLDNDLPF